MNWSHARFFELAWLENKRVQKSREFKINVAYFRENTVSRVFLEKY